MLWVLPGWHPPFSSFLSISRVWGAKSLVFVSPMQCLNFRRFRQTMCTCLRQGRKDCCPKRPFRQPRQSTFVLGWVVVTVRTTGPDFYTPPGAQKRGAYKSLHGGPQNIHPHRPPLKNALWPEKGAKGRVVNRRSLEGPPDWSGCCHPPHQLAAREDVHPESQPREAPASIFKKSWGASPVGTRAALCLIRWRT